MFSLVSYYRLPRKRIKAGLFLNEIQMDEDIEITTCLFLASLYDDPSKPGENLFEVNYNWRNHYEEKESK